MNDLIEKIGEYKNDIKNAIVAKYKEINHNADVINPGDNLSEYSYYITEHLSQEFENYFKSIGYKGIPKELLLTLQGQNLYKNSKEIEDLKKNMFTGADFAENLNNNRRCILLFASTLSGRGRFTYLNSLQYIYVLNDIYAEDPFVLSNYKESVISPYRFLRYSQKITHIYGILDMINVGYLIENSAGDDFFTANLKTGNVAGVAQASHLETIYMKNIHRAYNFGNSPLSMDSVLYCINNALYDAEYAEKEKTDDGKDGTYKFTLKKSAYSEEQRDVVIPNAVLARATELGGNGLNMEIAFV